MQKLDKRLTVASRPSVILDWEGKAQARQDATAPVVSSLVENRALSSSSETHNNLLVEGDNLAVLKLLRTKYSAAISVIYIDPPYNTGHKFHYLDRYESHARWLSMIYPRLLVSRELLNDQGIICISIDDNEVAHLRLIMDEIFGEDNCIAQITVHSNPRGRQAEKHIATVHEYVLIYAKNAKMCKLNGLQLTEAQLSEFNRVDESGKRYRLLGLRQRGAASRQEDRPALYYPVYVDPRSGKISLNQTKQFSEVALPKKSTGAAGRWMWCKETLAERSHFAEARLISKRNEWDVFVRDYADHDDGNMRTRKVSTLWDQPEFNYQNGKRELQNLLGECPVAYPKPVALIERCINLISHPDARVLDFFAGSGTTAQAVVSANLKDGGNRSFILVQTAEPLSNSKFASIVDVCRQRLLALGKTLVKSKHPEFSYLQLRP